MDDENYEIKHRRLIFIIYGRKHKKEGEYHSGKEKARKR